MKIVKWATLLGIASSMALLMSVGVSAKQSDDAGNTGGGNAGGGNVACPDGTEEIKFETTNGGQYNLVGGSGATVTPNSGDPLSGGTWTSTVPIHYVIVKGASEGAVTNDVRVSYSGSFSNSNLILNPSGKPPAISNIKFCTGPDPISVECKVCPPPGENVLAEPLSLDFFPKTVPLTCEVTKKNGDPVSGAEVVVSETSVTTGANGIAKFDVPWNPGTLNLVQIVRDNVVDIRDITEEEVVKIREATYAQLPVQTSYTAKVVANGSSVATDDVLVKLTQNNVTVEYVVLDDHKHGQGHVKFSFFNDGYCTVTDGEGLPPVGLRVWQPLAIPGLGGVLPGDMFSEGVHYKVVKPDQAEYILEKIDENGNSTLEPVVPTLK
jgi:hypothetical protein